MHIRLENQPVLYITFLLLYPNINNTHVTLQTIYSILLICSKSCSVSLLFLSGITPLSFKIAHNQLLCKLLFSICPKSCFLQHSFYYRYTNWRISLQSFPLFDIQHLLYVCHTLWKARSYLKFQFPKTYPRCACMCAKSFQSCPVLCIPMDCNPPGSSLHPWGSLGKNTGVGCYALLQGIFWTQRLNPCLLCLLHWQADSLSLVPPGKPTLDLLTQNFHGIEHSNLLIAP